MFYMTFMNTYFSFLVFYIYHLAGEFKLNLFLFSAKSFTMMSFKSNYSLP